MAPEHRHPDQRIAVTAEALYLANLLVLPLVAFLLLLWLRQYPHPGPLAGNHLAQTVRASLWAGVLLILLPLLILLLSGFESLIGWTLVIIWFVSCHAALVLGGAIGLARAMAGKPWRYPLIGGNAS